MKKVFTPEFFSQLIIQVLLSGVILFVLQKYYEHKWGPLTAAETLTRENYINAKKETFSQSLDILNRLFAKTKFYRDGKPLYLENRNIGGYYPNEAEANSCLAKLWIYSSDTAIPKLFFKFFGPLTTKDNVGLDRVKYINAIGKELSSTFRDIDTASITYIVIQTTDTIK